MAQQWNGLAEPRRQGMFSSAGEEMAVAGTPSLRCFQPVRGRET